MSTTPRRLPSQGAAVSYTRFHFLDDIERHAYATNDRDTLHLLALAEEAADMAREDRRDARIERIAQVRDTDAIARERDELRAEVTRLQHKLASAQRLAGSVEIVLARFKGSTKAPPRWAAVLSPALFAWKRGIVT